MAKEAQEKSVAQTRSFTCILVAARVLATILSRRSLSEELRHLPEFASDLIDKHIDLASELEGKEVLDIFFLGGGHAMDYRVRLC